MTAEPHGATQRDVHQISDARALRALSHPVRLALLEALATGPLTATEAGELIDETPTTCSFHLR
jgi:DNA-binding transcriptional ArsR family regulator